MNTPFTDIFCCTWTASSRLKLITHHIDTTFDPGIQSNSKVAAIQHEPSYFTICKFSLPWLQWTFSQARTPLMPHHHHFVQMFWQLRRTWRMLTFTILTRKFNHFNAIPSSSDHMKLESLTCVVFECLRRWCITRTARFAFSCVLGSFGVSNIWLD